jgi:hypothetical protein
MEVRRAQEIVEKHVVPNIFGPIACPNPALGPDDNHGWNSRTAPATKHLSFTNSNNTPGFPGLVPVRESFSHGRHPFVSPPSSTRSNELPLIPPPIPIRHAQSDSAPQHPEAKNSKSASKAKKSNDKQKKRFSAGTRYGWWNVADYDEENQGGASSDKRDDMESPDPLQLPPTEHFADAAFVTTRLTPTPEKLREENLPLSRLHAATSVASILPFLSDRPPSWRNLQIETRAVGFPSLGGEIEPLFCSLAIYHVEPQPNPSGGPRSAPVPNLQRCGRVTEFLDFDIVTDKDVEACCREALWPYLKGRGKELPEKERTQGTRCGAFPIPSNFAVSNLYAILIVRKIMSDPSDLEPYNSKEEAAEKKGGQTPPRSFTGGIDLSKYRMRAEKASKRNGPFLMHFAFGVAPLVQILGTDTPTVPTSRGVQVPLFRLTPGQSEKAIYNHIMVMLYPR